MLALDPRLRYAAAVLLFAVLPAIVILTVSWNILEALDAGTTWYMIVPSLTVLGVQGSILGPFPLAWRHVWFLEDSRSMPPRLLAWAYGATPAVRASLARHAQGQYVHTFDQWWFERAVYTFAGRGLGRRDKPTTSFAPYRHDPGLAIDLIAAQYDIAALRATAREIDVPELEVAEYARQTHVPVESLAECIRSSVPVEYARLG